MTFEYTENSTGKHTCVAYRDKDGAPMSARLPGWWPPHQVEKHLEYCRNNDRNRGARS